jgi:hypothetical protein
MNGAIIIKMIFTCSCLLLLWAGTCFSQSVAVSPKRFGLGVSAGHYGVDGGVGVDLTSPLVIRNHFGFRIRGNVVWLEEYKASLDHWATYNTALAGLLYRRRLAPRADFVTEAGAMIIFPDNRFSDDKIETGHYALVGVEHYLSHKINALTHYISIGLIASGAHAEKLEFSPKYGTGFVFNTGFRFCF